MVFKKHQQATSVEPKTKQTISAPYNWKMSYTEILTKNLNLEYSIQSLHLAIILVRVPLLVTVNYLPQTKGKQLPLAIRRLILKLTCVLSLPRTLSRPLHSTITSTIMVPSTIMSQTNRVLHQIESIPSHFGKFMLKEAKNEGPESQTKSNEKIIYVK